MRGARLFLYPDGMRNADEWDGGQDAGAAAILTIDLDAIAANWRLLAGRVAPAECAGVVKADAYGLGADRVARTLHRAGCRTFFVAMLAEARALRPHLAPDARILVLNGLVAGTEAECADAGVVPVINSLAQLVRWRDEAVRRGTALPLVLQVDTGMSRFGLSAAEIETLAGAPALAAGLQPSLLMSHLACADTPDHAANARQRADFERAVGLLAPVLPGIRTSLAASSGIFLGGDFHGGMVRPGAALYGVAPTVGVPNPMHPVVRLAARCVQVRRIAAGETVGYGATFTAARATAVATVAIGYADGFLRAGSNRGAVAAGGRILPILGLVSMDCITVDAGPVGDEALREGDLAELIGPARALGDVARDAGTIAYEILTSLGRRYARRYVGGDA